MKKVLLSLLLLIFILIPTLTRADVILESTPSVQVKVEKISNVMDRFKEKFTLFFKFRSEDKLSFQQQLVEQRLGELDYVIKNGQGDFIEEVSSRYAAYVGRYGENILSSKNIAQKKQALVMFKNHSQILAVMRDNFPANSSFWMLLQHDINTIQIYSDKIENSK